MGTSMAFYLVENRNLTPEILRERMVGLRRKAKSRSRGQEEMFEMIISSFLDLNQEHFEEVKDEMQRESPETFAFISKLMGKKAAEGPDNIIPFPGTTPPEEQEMSRGKGPVLAWRANARWLPFFEENLCDGYNASSRDAGRLAKAFGAPVLAFSIFDSDILFLSYADPERRLRLDFAKADFEEAEEMIDSPFQMEFPQFLCTWGDEQTLREIWEGEEVFADDRMAKLCGVIGAEVLYDGQDLPEGYERIE